MRYVLWKKLFLSIILVATGVLAFDYAIDIYTAEFGESYIAKVIIQESGLVIYLLGAYLFSVSVPQRYGRDPLVVFLLFMPYFPLMFAASMGQTVGVSGIKLAVNCIMPFAVLALIIRNGLKDNTYSLS